MLSRKNNKKVLIAMSGGVDSSVAAALLKKQGYDCVGAFFITWTQDVCGLKMCPWEDDIQDARKVCAKIGIPMYTFNFEKEYKARVIEYFFAEYKQGRTPNPDIMCNKEIKFGLFLDKAKQLGFDYIATGHYAQIKKKGSHFELHKGKDPNKDQSYFLYALTEEQLKYSLFPIGNLKKPKVRQLAKKYRLPNAAKKDSQGICFLGHVKIRDFLKTRIKPNGGDIVDQNSKKVGEHEGIMYYTIGQRHGLNIGGAGEPYYVVDKDKKTNQLIVSKRKNDEQYLSDELKTETITWVGVKPKLPMQANVKIRYRQEDQECVVDQIDENSLEIKFEEKQRSIAPGQSVVIYDKTRVVGGGIIK